MLTDDEIKTEVDSYSNIEDLSLSITSPFTIREDQPNISSKEDTADSLQIDSSEEVSRLVNVKRIPG